MVTDLEHNGINQMIANVEPRHCCMRQSAFDFEHVLAMQSNSIQYKATLIIHTDIRCHQDEVTTPLANYQTCQGMILRITIIVLAFLHLNVETLINCRIVTANENKAS